MVAATDIRPMEQISSIDPIWDLVKAEARIAADNDPVMATFLYSTVINHKSLEDAVIYRICERLDHADIPAVLLRQTFEEMNGENPE
jgi:serine O-acetyltransferase